MDGIQLRPVSLEGLSGIRHETFVSSETPPEFLVIRFFGAYRIGSAGQPDAQYIIATAKAAMAAWYSRSVILDFQDLAYQWGDNMMWVTAIRWDGGTRLDAPMAIVVGDKCRTAMMSLLPEKYEKYCADTLEQASLLCRQQEVIYKQLLKERRNTVKA